MESELRINPEIGFVCWESSLQMPPRCVFYRLHHIRGDRLPYAVLQHLIHLPQPSLSKEQHLTQKIGIVKNRFQCFLVANRF
ncbi:unnamed protein product [Gongylonema pulchrum]|uniref:Condensation domain-containing protein n=1 Tax=Gongylonema pulchrum TaxID=637853 RepID=A0A183EWV4_9BILA|nr:unnamed protein product [Gongylonema pulchrum]